MADHHGSIGTRVLHGIFAVMSLLIFLFLWACNKQEPANEEVKQKWYKGNLHTHSFWSDGDDFPEMIMEWYKNHDYDFIALSDHNILANKDQWLEIEDSLELIAFNRYLEKYGAEWVNYQEDSAVIKIQLKTLQEYRPLFEQAGEFLILQAEEITDIFDDKPVHLNATNLVDLIPPQGGTSVTDVLQRNINAVLHQRELTGEPMMVHINHPNFHYAITVEDMIALQGERFFEVFNGHPIVFNLGDSVHMDTETMWDQVNIAYLKNAKPLLYGLATDDSHNYHSIGSQWSNSGRGWIWVQADTLGAASLIASMEQGRFYASTGVTLNQLEFKDNVLAVGVDKNNIEHTIQFIGCTRQESNTRILEEVTGHQGHFEVTEDLLFVRAKIISTVSPDNPIENITTQTAWTQPVVYTK